MSQNNRHFSSLYEVIFEFLESLNFEYCVLRVLTSSFGIIMSNQYFQGWFEVKLLMAELTAESIEKL